MTNHIFQKKGITFTSNGFNFIDLFHISSYFHVAFEKFTCTHFCGLISTDFRQIQTERER